MKFKIQLNFKEFLFIFSFTFCFLHNNKVVTGTQPDAKECEPKSCGNGINISYPFWLEGQQPSYCGYPLLNLSCNSTNTNTNSPPVLKGRDKSFYIKDIFYENRSVIVVPAEVADGSCPLPSKSYTGLLYPFNISSANVIIFFLLNCSNPLSGYNNISCAGNGTFDYFGGVYKKDTELISDARQCQLITVPTVRYTESNNDNFIAVVRDGWLVNWDLPDCSECKESGGTCGYNSSQNTFMCICSDRVHKVSCKKMKKKKRLGLIIGAAAASGVVLSLAVLFIIYKRKKRARNSPSSKSLIKDISFRKDGEYLNTHLFSYEELVEATNGFDSCRELGDGGFGTVYKGELRDGRIVAIKRLYENNYRRLEQFMNEVDILSTLRHQNLVDLYGCTSRLSRELLLVYEYVSNGTVADHLHGSRATEGILTWPLRLSIAIETADALAYLHAVNPQIIHRDVKTNNILLDSSFHVKVADFGLSRLFPTDVTHVSTAPQGTPGYVDPEYHQCYQLTEKSDVYSFGVVLVELISSKPAVDITRHRSEINLANMAITKIQNGEVDQLVDMKLGYELDGSIRIMINMVAELAFRCLQSDGDMRPPIKDVLETLRKIQGQDYAVPKKGDDEARTRDDVQLLKNVAPFSPDTVINNWTSRSTTPNTSG